jgi:hypothetical protein
MRFLRFPPPPLVRQKATAGFITRQLLRRPPEPFKKQQVIPFFQFRVPEFQQIVFFRLFSGHPFYDRLSFGLPKLSFPDVLPYFPV